MKRKLAGNFYGSAGKSPDSRSKLKILNSSYQHFEEIDRLRGIAILMVIFDHLAVPPLGILSSLVNPFFRETWTGVDLFFVISGFVVFRSLRRDSISSFYRRRFWRIAPLAVFWAAIPLMAVWAMGDFSETTSFTQIWHDFVEILTLRYNYFFAYSSKASLLLSPYWSLCVEEHFYLILPLLSLIVPGRAYRTAIILAIIALSPLAIRPWIYHWTQPPHPVPYFRCATHCRLDGLFLGVLLADWWPDFRNKFWTARTWLPFGNTLALGAIALLVIWPNYIRSIESLNWGNSITAAISGFLVFLASLNRGYVLNIPGLRSFLASTGRHSYALYLAHVPAYYFSVALFHANQRVLTSTEILSITFAYLSILSALAIVCRRWIEEPLITFGKKISQRA